MLVLRINEWNRLPGECVNATIVNTSKNKTDKKFRNVNEVDYNKRINIRLLVV